MAAAIYNILDTRDYNKIDNKIDYLSRTVNSKEYVLQLNIDKLSAKHEELKAYAENNKTLIDGLTTDKISHSEIVDGVSSEWSTDESLSNVPLSAKAGSVVYNTALEGISQAQQVNTRVSNVENALDARLDVVEHDVNTFLNNADLTENAIDTLREIQNYIKTDGEKAGEMIASIKANADAIKAETTRATNAESNLDAKKINYDDIVDSWSSTETKKPLSANQGNELRLQIAGTMSNHNNLVHGPLDTRIGNIETNITNLQNTKVNTADIVNDLTTGGSTKVLSAQQGVELKSLYDNIPSWALAATKPTYTYTEVGADESGAASNAVSAHNIATDAHSDIRQAIKSTNDALTHRIPTTAILDDLDSTVDRTGKVLSAGQGDMLYGLIKDLITRVAALEGGSTATE